ncbi:unnamed protein product [Nippostrongylus brasiliensis]|uniref:Adenylosuccinate lyase n=1 Tax=Nippostrongylus brasiliensis TaxID=27835 RepID=A0A0N4YNN6_NIPBR|nr:hypothetical protein Q1695_004146 [Nippostrongylus brasiliensis]VDL82576.1 unnamed protein product [Nippostrongylus brasiliensis]
MPSETITILKFLNNLKRFGADFADARSRIVEANGYLMKVLVQTSREVVQDLLEKAFHAECGALVRAKIECHEGEDVTEKKALCALVYSIGSTIQGLADAVVDLEADALKKAQLRGIQDDFVEQFPDASPNDAYTLGHRILNAMNKRS